MNNGVIEMSHKKDFWQAWSLSSDSEADTVMLAPLLEVADEVYFSVDDYIVSEGEDANDFYLILDGSVRVYREGVVFKEFVTILRAGSVIGMNPRVFFDGELTSFKRTADVVCASLVKALKISFEKMNLVLKQHPKLRRILVERERDLIVNHFIDHMSEGKGLEREVKEKIAQQVDTVTLEPSAVLFHQGDPSDSAYFILDGSCIVEYEGAVSGERRQVAELATGRLVGELGVIRDVGRNATVTAKTKCNLLRIPYDGFRELLSELPSAMKRVKKLRDFRIRPKLRNDLVYHKRMAYDGEEKLILEHPETHDLLEIYVDDTEVLELIDGQRCFRDIISHQCNEKNELQHIDYYSSLLYRLVEFGYAESPRMTVELKKQKQEKPSFRDRLERMLTAEYEFTEIDGKLERLYQTVGRHFFSWYGQIVMAGLSIAGFVLFFPLYFTIIPHVDVGMLLAIFPAEFVLGWVSLLGHELAHGMAVHDSGTRCYKGGLAWYWVGPVGYMDTSMMWTKPLKDKLKVNLAGVYFNVFFAALWVIPAYLGWFNVYFSALAWFFAFGSFFGVLGNLSSLLEYDGYYVIMDLCNMPNLRGRSCIWLMETLPQMVREKVNPFRGYAREAWYWCYTLSHVLISIIVVQLVVIDIIWPIWGIKPSSNIFWDMVRGVLIFLALYLAARTAMTEVKEGRMSG